MRRSHPHALDDLPLAAHDRTEPRSPWSLERDAYRLRIAGGGRDTLVIAAFDDLTLPLSELWLELA